MKNTIRFILLFFAGWVLSSCSKDDGAGETPVAAGAIEVRGTLVDIRSATVGEKVFPQNDNYLFQSDVEALFETPQSYAVGLMESRGAEAFRCGSTGTVYLATDCADMQAEGWTSRKTSFRVGEIDYYLYAYNCTTPNRWIDIPDPAGRKYSTLLFAPKLSVAGTSIPGTVIAQVPVLRQYAINNVCMTILPNGEYIAACTGSTVENQGVSLFVSSDRGRSWKVLSQNNLTTNGIANYCNIFVHDGILYMMGVGSNRQNVLITRSEDNGRTWTLPQDEESGILMRGAFHSSSVPMVVSGGRIWRGMETYDNDVKTAFVLSAPADADLLKASSWTATNTIPGTTPVNESWEFDGKRISELIEGNVVATPDGKLYNILRASSSYTSLAAGMATIADEKTLEITAPDDLIRFPGGGKKFTIRYDEQSHRYWTLTNPASDNVAGMSHNGIYASGITENLVRNRLVLCYSTDLTTWIQYKEIVSDPDPFFHGFQYVDWMFDGEDIVAVCRMACPESRGLPVRQHDANFMTFFRIEHFRTL